LKLLLDEMYPPALAQALVEVGIEAVAVAEFGLSGRSDPDVFAAAADEGAVLLTENVGDFARIAADQITSGLHHPGLVLALSSRFSRRPAGRGELVAAVGAIASEALGDRVVYLERVDAS